MSTKVWLIMLIVVHYCYRFLCTVVTDSCALLLPFFVHSPYHFLCTRDFCLQQDDMQFSILQGLKFQHCPAGLLRTFSICADGCAAETELPLDFSQRSPFCELPDDYS